MVLLQALVNTDPLPPDGGIVYAETSMQRLIPEPLNTITACLFTAIAIYWIVRLKGFSRQSRFLSLASYILLVGSIGGTAYHGLRLYKIFIFMDWVPILLLCMMACAYFWAKVLEHPGYTMGMIFLFFLAQFVLRQYLERQNHLDWAVNISYLLMASMVITPLLIYLYRTRFNYAILVFSALGCFAMALFFRVSDHWQLLSAGTHFLWHTLGATATQLMFLYIYRIERLKKPLRNRMGTTTA